MDKKIIINIFGDQWTLEHEESNHLETIDGFLMTWFNLSKIILSTYLTAEDRARARGFLEQRLVELPVGDTKLILWSNGDD